MLLAHSRPARRCEEGRRGNDPIRPQVSFPRLPPSRSHPQLPFSFPQPPPDWGAGTDSRTAGQSAAVRRAASARIGRANRAPRPVASASVGGRLEEGREEWGWGARGEGARGENLGPDGCSPRPFLSEPRDLSSTKYHFRCRGFISVAMRLPAAVLINMGSGVMLTRGRSRRSASQQAPTVGSSDVRPRSCQAHA